MQVTTDHAVPLIPQIVNISYECDKDITINWMPLSSPISFYRVLVHLDTGKPASYNTTDQKVSYEGSESEKIKFIFRWI